MSESRAHTTSPTDADAFRRASKETFGELTEPFRRELTLHCYRMIGSVPEAEDLVQETLLRGWRARASFEGRSSVRAWLYSIATNACLNALKRRTVRSRMLWEPGQPASTTMPKGAPDTADAWLEPYPNLDLDLIPDAAPGPDARYEMHEAVRLAFVAAVQQLPPRQRAVLLLRDVMGWSAIEAANALGGSVESINSALQRARGTLAKLPEGVRLGGRDKLTEDHTALVDRYVTAWESSDLGGFIDLLRADAVYRMPPWRQWYQGRSDIRAFFKRAWAHHGAFRLLPTQANGQPAFAVYWKDRTDGEWLAQSIHVLDIRDGEIVSLTAYVGSLGPKLVPRFQLPSVLA